MKLFDVGNSRGMGFWVVARDTEHALEIALRDGHIKKPFARVQDVTDRWEGDMSWASLNGLLEGTVGGHVELDQRRNLWRYTYSHSGAVASAVKLAPPSVPDWPPARRTDGMCEWCGQCGRACQCHRRKTKPSKRYWED
jgi:hypothetical protein